MILFLVSFSLVINVALTLAIIVLARLVVQTNTEMDRDLSDVEMDLIALHAQVKNSAGGKIQLTLPIDDQFSVQDVTAMIEKIPHVDLGVALDVREID